MSTQDHYSLRWNNHQNHILRAFDTLLQTKTLVDVTLVCAETSIRAHKMVLSACSPFFQRVFSETPCKHPVIVLKDFRGWVVQAIVDFMYRGEISVPQERLQTLIQAGESLQVRGLVENTVPGNTPTPAASPDDFSMLDGSLLPAELERCQNYESETQSLLSTSSKLLMPHHVFMDGSHHNTHLQSSELCTSPMPRRKQARPRRRSGECGPHDLSKPSSPALEDSDVKMDQNGKCEMRIKNEDRISNTQRDIENNSETCDKNDDILSSEEINEGPQNLCTKRDNEDSQNGEVSDCNSINNNDTTKNITNNNTILNNNISSNSQNISDSNFNKSCTNNKNSNNSNHLTDENSNQSGTNNNTNNNRLVLSLKDIRQLNKPPTIARSPNPFQPPSLNPRACDTQSLKSESLEGQMDSESPFQMEQIDLSMAAAAAAAAQHHHQMTANSLLGLPNHPGHRHDRLDELANQIGKEFTPSSPMSLPSHFNPPDGPPHPPSPLPFPGMSSALALTPPHMFGLDSPLGLFPPGMDPGKLYNPLMEMSDPRGLSNDHPPFLKKKMSRPKGQHSAPRGGPPRSWTNAELTEALQHVWNKKMTTSQASRIFGIPYNSLLMYVRGKYGKSLKLEQLRKDCISGPPIELLTMGIGGNNNNNNKNPNENRNKEIKDIDGPMQRSSSSEPDLLSSPNPLFNPFPPGFYPDFPGGFPGLPLGMLNLLPPERHQPPMHLNMDEDCKSDRSKQSIEDDFSQPLALNRDDRREMLHQNGQD